MADQFIVVSDTNVGGYSLWPWDPFYSPVVGCFVDGLLHRHAFCDPEPQVIGLDGPGLRCWFRLDLERSLVERLRDGDPTVRILRLEDGARVTTSASAGEQGAAKVQALLSVGARSGGRLDGYPAFVALPGVFQLDLLFMDYFRRLPDPEAYASYLPSLEDGRAHAMDVRQNLMASEEFRRRPVRMGDGLGSMITSPLLPRYLEQSAPGWKIRSLQQFRVSDHAGLSTADYLRHVYSLFLNRHIDEVGAAHYKHVAETQGRGVVANDLAREAAHQRRFFHVVDDPA